MTKRHIVYSGSRGEADRRALAVMSPLWSIQFTECGADVLKLLERNKVDAIITEAHLPDMDGFELLNQVLETQSETHRFIFTEPGEMGLVVKSVRFTHQCVPHSNDMRQLSEIIERSFAIGEYISNPAVRKLMSRMAVVPSPPELYFEVVAALNAPDADIESVVEKAERDVAMTAKLLHVANSAALGLGREVTNAGEAIQLLGLEMTRSLILISHTFSHCAGVQAAGFSIEHLWDHSLATGRMARQIAQLENASTTVIDESFLAGVLHDLGKLLLAVNIPKEYSTALHAIHNERETPPWQIEARILGVTHAEIGAELLAAWNLPLPVVEALALHHQPAELFSSGFRPLTAVHAANALANHPEAPLIDLKYLESLGLGGRLEIWMAACRQR